MTSLLILLCSLLLVLNIFLTDVRSDSSAAALAEEINVDGAVSELKGLYQSQCNNNTCYVSIKKLFLKCSNEIS